MHSRVFVFNNSEMDEETLYDSISICDYVIEEDEEEMKDSIYWFRKDYLNQENNEDTFNKEEIEVIRAKIKYNNAKRLDKVEEITQKIKQGVYHVEMGLWEIKRTVYPETNFFFVTDDYRVCNEVELLRFLDNVTELKITKTFDYHY